MCKLRQKLKLHLLTARKYIWYVIKNAVKSEMYTHNIIRILDGLFCNNCVEYLKPQTAMMPRTFFFFCYCPYRLRTISFSVFIRKGTSIAPLVPELRFKTISCVSDSQPGGVAKYPIRRGVATS